MSSELHYKQNPLFGEKLMSSDKEILRVGMNAVEVVNRIFDFYSVNRFSYTEYDPESIYPMGADQALYWNNWSGVGNIMDLSTQITNRTVQKFEIEGLEVNVQNILAIGSKVETKDAVKHVPMLDFEFTDGEKGIEMIANSGLSEGVILQTDHSYHYYGLNLIDEGSWRKWIKNLLFIKDTERLFGKQYLKLCLDRGYSALRVFGYEGTSKAMTPVVIAKV